MAQVDTGRSVSIEIFGNGYACEKRFISRINIHDLYFLYAILLILGKC